VLYIGPICRGSTAEHRLKAIHRLGCRVTALDTTLPFGKYETSFLKLKKAHSFFVKTNNYFDWNLINYRAKRLLNDAFFDVVWIDKGQSIQPDLLDYIKSRSPKTCVVNYSPDDMFNPKNQTTPWRSCLPKYDLFVTTKTYNVGEYLEAGAKAALFVGNAYEPTVHRPVSPNIDFQRQWGSQVVFVGASEPDRNASLENLATSGVSLGLYGGGTSWRPLARSFSNVRTKDIFLTDELYALVLCSCKIALGFLRKQNRDRQTTRSIEIPACGVFMLAERTEEHLEMFEEGLEAEFFSTDEELTSKVKFYLSNESARESIATKGLQRCQASGYSNDCRIAEVLQYILANHK
jgi:hypothetical protein